MSKDKSSAANAKTANAKKKAAANKGAPSSKTGKIRTNAAGPANITVYSAHFQSTQPLPGRGILLRNITLNLDGTINGKISIVVRKTVNSTAENVAVQVRNFADPFNLDNNWNNVGNDDRLNFNNVTGIFSRDYQVLNLPNIQPRANNRRILIKAYNNQNAAIENETFGFIVVPPNPAALVSVPAKGCLFFSYTAFGVPLPRGEKLPDNLPATIPAPIDAAHVTIFVPLQPGGQPQQWTNEHGLCDANGAPPNDPDKAIDAYRSPLLGSENMKRLIWEHLPQGNFLDGMLTGMLDYGPENASHPDACIQEPIGTAVTQFDLLNIGSAADPIKPVNLLMGLHTDDDWTTPRGYLDVSLSWT